MNVIVASTHVPFIRGGGTQIVDDLHRSLTEAGHTSEVVTLPVWESWTELPAQMAAMRLFDLAPWCDRLITIRTPSHLLRHPDKFVWFLHHHRGAYDLWGTEYQDIPDSPEGRAVRDAIVQADALGFGEATKIFANSPTSRDRLQRYNGITADVLYPPLANADLYRCEPAERYVVLPSRIAPAKRQCLAVEAMSLVSSNVSLVIAGPPDEPAALAALNQAIERHDVAHKVTLRAEWISEDEKRQLLARSLGCLFIPFDEDSYGYVGLEACASSKPLITCTDSGGVLQLVTDGSTGFVVEPNAQAIADAIDRLASDPRAAAEMGRALSHRPAELGVSWTRIVEAFTR